MFKKAEYVAIIDENNPVAKNHILHGEQVLPGVVYLEFCISLLKGEGIDVRHIVFSDCLFYTPLNANCQRQLYINVEQQDGQWFMKGKSKVNHSNENVFTNHFECKVQYVEEIDDETIDLTEVLNQSIETIEIDRAYEFVREAGITHKSYMKPLGHVYRVPDGIMGNIYFAIGNSIEDELVKKIAVFDSSTVIPYLTIESMNRTVQKEKAYIPLCVEQFRIYDEIPTEVYISVKNEDVFFAENEDFCYASWKIYDKSGKKVAQFHKLSSKKIRVEGMATSKQNIVVEDKIVVQEEKQSSSANKTNIKQYLIHKIGEMLNTSVQEEQYELGFYELGLNSKDLIDLVHNIENEFGCQLYPTIMFEYSTINQFSEYLEEEYGSSFAKVSVSKSVPEKNYSVEHESKLKEHRKEAELVAYQLEWMRQTLDQVGKEQHYKKMIVLSEQTELVKELSSQVQIVAISKGNTLRKLQDHIYVMNPMSEEEFAYILNQEVNENERVAIVDMWDYDCLQQNHVQNAEYNVYYHNLAMAKALAKYNKRGCSFRILSIGYHEAYENNYTRALAGFYKCFLKEKSGITASIVTMDMIENVGLSETLSNVILNEINEDTYTVSEINYKGQERWVKAIKEQSVNTNMEFPQQGVYVVSGGLGKIARAWIEEIVQRNESTFILLGRSTLDEEKERWLRKVNQYQAKVVYKQVDINEKEAVTSCFTAIAIEYNKITGIVHTAGILKDELVATKSVVTSQVEPVIQCKIIGLHNMLEAVKNMELEFFLTFSSISATFGNVGQSNYAYANAYMDNYYMAPKRNNVKHYISINWPVWSQGGMQFGYDEDVIYQTTGLASMKTDVGVQCILSVSKQNTMQVIFLLANVEQCKKEIDRLYPSYQEQTPTINKNDIAIIGMSGKFPMAEDMDELWDNLISGKDCITKVPKDRWTQKDVNQLLGSDRLHVCQYGGFLHDIDAFDARLFHITPMEAKNMDPQERLFLSTVWNTIEDAGYSKEHLEQEDIGVFVGNMWGQYQMGQSKIDGQTTLPSSIYASIANRVSYYFNWCGPSLTIDTMCSSTMTALKYACDSLQYGNSKMAIVGGVNLSMHPAKYIVLAQNNFTAADGKCRSFGEGGQGYVPGEGVGAFLIKRVEDAIKDHDHIYGVIKSCEINHGGRTSGYSVPSVKQQSKVVNAAIKAAGIHAKDVSYIEAHGTGTSLGDPIEISALQKVFEQYTNQLQFCSIGSIKSNIGHLEAASCVASIAKVLLQFEHKKLVPSLHSTVINPNIDFKKTAFYCQQTYEDWVCNGPRIAGISAFGAGGSNGHMILEEYQEHEPMQLEKREQFLFLYSAGNKETLNHLLQKQVAFLKRKLHRSQSTMTVRDERYEALSRCILSNLCPDSVKNIHDVTLMELGFDPYLLNGLIQELYSQGYQVPSTEVLLAQHHLIELIDMIGEENQIHKYRTEVTINETDGITNSERYFLQNYEYTLQVGRVHMKTRVGIVAGSIKELVEAIEQFIHGHTCETVYFNDELTKDKMILNIFGNEDGKKLIFSMIEKGSLGNVAQIWCKGVTIDWERMTSSNGKRRVSAPGYPFSGQQIERASFRMKTYNENIEDETEEEQIDVDLFSIVQQVKAGKLFVDEAAAFLRGGIRNEEE